MSNSFTQLVSHCAAALEFATRGHPFERDHFPLSFANRRGGGRPEQAQSAT